MTPPCNRCICVGMCLQKLREYKHPKCHPSYPHFNLSYTNVAMKLVDECSILAKYLEKKKPEWCVSNSYNPDDIDKLCNFCEKKIVEIRG